MILQVKNLANYEQSVTLHTGEAKAIDAGLALRINTGTDKRLINYYVSLINYNFDVSIVSSSDEEANNFYDSIKKFNKIKNDIESQSKYQDNNVYPINKKMDEGHITAIPEDKYDPNPNVLPDNKISSRDTHRTYLDSQQGLVADKIEIPANSIMADVMEVVDENKSNAPVVEIVKPTEELVDAKSEVEPIEDSVNEDSEIEQQVEEVISPVEDKVEEVSNSDNSVFDDKYKLLDTLDESVLRTILSDKFNEVSKARSKWKVAYRIIELADASNIDIQDLYNEYNN